MAIKIKHRDPKYTDFGPNDIIINVKNGTLFYKSEKNIFKLTGDNLDKNNDLIVLDSNISASKAFFATPGIGEMIIGVQDNNAFEIGTKTVEIGGSIIPLPSNSPKYDLGSLDTPWRDVYLSQDSLHFVKQGKGVQFSQIENGFTVEDYQLQSIKDSVTMRYVSSSDNLVISAGISSSGTNSTFSSITGSFDHIITAGETIEFRNKTTKAVEGFVKFDPTNGLQIQDSSRNPTKLKGKSLEVESALFTNITASVISCSGTIIADAFQSTGEDDQLDFSDHINVTGNITASGTIKAEHIESTDDMTVAGDLDVAGEIECDHLNIADIDDGIHFNNTKVLFVDASNNVNLGVAAHLNTIDLELYGYNHTYTIGNNLTLDAAGDITLDAAGGNVSLIGNVTASGAISASGNILADGYTVDGYAGLTNATTTLYVGNANYWDTIQYGRQDTDQHRFVGNITASGNISGSGNLSMHRQFDLPGGNGTTQGDIVYIGSAGSTFASGKLHYLRSNGDWELADKDSDTTSDTLLGFALGAAVSNGILIRGMFRYGSDLGTLSDVLYVGDSGVPTNDISGFASGDIIRIIGYLLGSTNGELWFNPDGTFIEKA